jgi:hypothetical protein
MQEVPGETKAQYIARLRMANPTLDPAEIAAAAAAYFHENQGNQAQLNEVAKGVLRAQKPVAIASIPITAPAYLNPVGATLMAAESYRDCGFCGRTIVTALPVAGGLMRETQAVVSAVRTTNETVAIAETTYRGVAGVAEAEQRVATAFVDGLPPRGAGVDPTMENLLTSINEGSSGSGWVQSSKAWDVAKNYATNGGTRGGVIYELAPNAGVVDANASSIASRVRFPEQQIVAYPGGVQPSDIVRAYIVDKSGAVIKVIEKGTGH